MRSIVSMHSLALFANGGMGIRPVHIAPPSNCRLSPMGQCTEIPGAPHIVWLSRAAKLRLELRKAERQRVPNVRVLVWPVSRLLPAARSPTSPEVALPCSIEWPPFPKAEEGQQLEHTAENCRNLVRTSHVMSLSFWLSLISVNAPVFALYSASFCRGTRDRTRSARSHSLTECAAIFSPG